MWLDVLAVLAGIVAVAVLWRGEMVFAICVLAFVAAVLGIIRFAGFSSLARFAGRRPDFLSRSRFGRGCGGDLSRRNKSLSQCWSLFLRSSSIEAP
jgi:hypothetical protein